MKKLIFLDIDGTMIISGRPPSEAVAAAIRAARANGHKVFLSTGRLEANIPENIRSVGFDGGIYSAGGRAVVNGSEILNRFMPAELVRQVTGLLREWGLFFFLENASGTYMGVDRFPSWFRPEWVHIMTNELHVLPPDRMPERDPVYKVVFYTREKAQAEQLGRRLNEVARVVCFNHVRTDRPAASGEISDWSIDKGTALNCICRRLDSDPEDCIAFGDSMNDLEILQAAGLGIAMGNADEELIQMADQVCERCDEDGVAKAFARLGLI